MIRTYEDREKNGSTNPDTIVEPVNRELAIYAYSADEAETKIRKDIAGGKLPAGRVYQICPWMANPELIRSVAASLDGSFQRVFLDPASGLYGELRRIRLPRPAAQ
jgi:hypothetical protein